MKTMSRKKMGLLLVCSLLTCLVGWSLFSASSLAAPAIAGRDAAPTLSAGDKEFISEAACGGMAEVVLGQLAQQKAQSELVRKFGQHMIEDHTKVNGELKDLATRLSVTIPTELKPKQKRLLDTLSGQTGAAFDKQYMDAMVKDHEEDVAAFQKEAEQGKNMDLTSWVKNVLPTLQSHLTMARDADAKVKTGPGKSASKPIDRAGSH